MRNNNQIEAPFIGIVRHRLLTDGDGVTTLVAFHGCSLHCRYCLNPQSLQENGVWRWMDCRELYEMVKVDELYFLATGGGVTFGGGEPCLRSKFIQEFRKLCGEEWKLAVETSLNVSEEYIKQLLPVVNHFIVDVKDMNPDIYRNYTGGYNKRVLQNLRLLAERGRMGDVSIRLPLIPGYNTMQNQEEGRKQLVNMGFMDIEMFTYKTLEKS